MLIFTCSLHMLCYSTAWIPDEFSNSVSSFWIFLIFKYLGLTFTTVTVFKIKFIGSNFTRIHFSIPTCYVSTVDHKKITVVVKFNLQMIHWNCIFWSILLFWICKTGSQRCLNNSFLDNVSCNRSSNLISCKKSNYFNQFVRCES